MTKFSFTPAKYLLTNDQRASLSGQAIALFTDLWNRAAYAGRPEIRTINSEACKRAHISTEELQSAQHELHVAGYLSVELDDRPGFVIEAQRTLYTFPQGVEEETE